jgi:hypothetical protein
MSSNSLIFFHEFRGDICAQSFSFCGLSAESQNFPRIIPRKGMPFRGIILESQNFPWTNPQKGIPFHGKACNRELFCVKAGFSMLKSMESFYFSHTFLRKGMPFCRIIRGKSKLPAYHTSEKHAFLQDNPRKSKLSVNYPAESFSILRKVKISLFKGISLLLQIILHKSQPWVTNTTRDLTKNLKNMV